MIYIFNITYIFIIYNIYIYIIYKTLPGIKSLKEMVGERPARQKSTEETVIQFSN